MVQTHLSDLERDALEARVQLGMPMDEALAELGIDMLASRAWALLRGGTVGSVANAAKRVDYGHWLEAGGASSSTCEACGAAALVDADGKYCPACGAGV